MTQVYDKYARSASCRKSAHEAMWRTPPAVPLTDPLRTSMSWLSRRAFLGSLAAAVPVATFVRRAHAAAVNELATSSETLHALGAAILPSELGPAGAASAVSAFQHWISGYREHAELLHGYGTSALAYSGPTPATRWAAQLEALDRAARRNGSRSFAALPLERRREMVRTELGGLTITGMPAVGRSQHVALALLSHWYGGTDATDRCYRASIGKQQCRPLATSARAPLPLAGGRG